MSHNERIAKLLAFLRKNEGDRGIMADLRCGFSPGTEYRAWPHIAPLSDLADDRQRIICQTVAAGYATHGHTSRCGNMGTTIRKLALTGGAGHKEDALRSFDGRFRRLLTCDTVAELCKRLVPIIRAAERKGIPIDFELLYQDLLQWDAPENDVKIRWAATYWADEPQRKPMEGGEGV